jgi:hypothetical protein
MMTVRRGSDSEQQAIPDNERSFGDPWVNTDRKVLQIYHSGSGANFKVSEISNLLFRSRSKIGIGSTKRTVYDEEFINTNGKLSNVVFVIVEYTPFTSAAGEVEAIVTDGSSPVSDKDTFSSDPTPTAVQKTFILESSGFTLDDILNIQLLVQNANVRFVEFRGA